MSSGKMHSYKLTVRFYSPLVLYDPITLDALVAYALAVRGRKTRGIFCAPQRLPDEGKEVSYKLRSYIEHHSSYYPVALSSYLQPVQWVPEYLDSWKKRFETKYHHMVDFGRGRRRVDTASGKYRSYNMPLPAQVIQEGYFLFIGKGDAVLDLLREQIVAIGKKRGMGFGWVEEFRLESYRVKDHDIARLRPVPVHVAKRNRLDGPVRFCAWRPPYWLRRNMCECVVPS